MFGSHLVRVGALGHVGRFTAVDSTRYPRGARVIVRTERGVEIGEVLAPPADRPLGHDEPRAAAQQFANPWAGDGTILRGMTIEDQLLEARLDKHRQSALEACQTRLDVLGLTATLMDVEHLFDGQTLVFYFLGDPPREMETIAAELTEAYEAKAQFRSFVDSLSHGCGPGCGTESATGGGCDSCATGCAVAGACSTRRSATA